MVVDPVEEQSSSTLFSFASTQTTLSMKPTVETSSLGKRDSTYTMIFACVDPYTGYYVPNTGIAISDYNIIEYSGGHQHSNDLRPKGDLYPISGVTSGSGTWTTTYTAPEFAGITEAELICDAPSGPTAPYVFTIGVRTPNFVPLPTSADYNQVGGAPEIPQHPINHYGTSTFVQKLILLAKYYRDRYPDHKLSFNDMSLPEGGLFDINHENLGWWKTPHKGHRFGIAADLKAVPIEHRRQLKKDLYNIMRVAFWTDEYANKHWHFRM